MPAPGPAGTGGRTKRLGPVFFARQAGTFGQRLFIGLLRLGFGPGRTDARATLAAAAASATLFWPGPAAQVGVIVLREATS